MTKYFVIQFKSFAYFFILLLVKHVTKIKTRGSIFGIRFFAKYMYNKRPLFDFLYSLLRINCQYSLLNRERGFASKVTLRKLQLHLPFQTSFKNLKPITLSTLIILGVIFFPLTSIKAIGQ